MSLILLLVGGTTSTLPAIIVHTSSVDASGVALPSLRGASASIAAMMPSASLTHQDGNVARVTERRASAEVSK